MLHICRGSKDISAAGGGLGEEKTAVHGAVSSAKFLLWLCMNLEMGSVPSWFEKTGLQCSVKPLTAKDVLHFPEATEYFCLKSHEARIFHLVRHFVTENLLVTDYLY